MTTFSKSFRRQLASTLNRAAKLTEDQHPQDSRDFEVMAAQVLPANRIKKPMQRQREARENTDRLDVNEKTARIRGACLARSGGYCECNCGRRFVEGDFLLKPEMDEWENGNGRRRQKRAISTCWMLTASCHGRRQRYSPGVAYWNEKRRQHDEKHIYPHHPHIENAQLPRKSARTA